MRFFLVVLLSALLISSKRCLIHQGIPILMYHRIDTDSSRYCISPEEFESHLEKLFKAGLVTTRLDEALNKKDFNKKIVLRFDDSWRSQFNYLEDGTINPRCAVGIILNFYQKHPSFGKHAFFALIPTMCFQQPKHKKKNRLMLLDEGMHLATHAIDHVDITNAQPEDIDNNFGKALAYWYKFLGNTAADIKMVATPYGTQPKDPEAEKQLRCFSYKGTTYPQEAVLYAGSNYTGIGFDPYQLPCFEVTSDNFDDILAFIR